MGTKGNETASKEIVREPESDVTEESSDDEAVVFVPRASAHRDAYVTARSQSEEDEKEVEQVTEIDITVDEQPILAQPDTTTAEEERVLEVEVKETQTLDATDELADETNILSDTTTEVQVEP